MEAKAVHYGWKESAGAPLCARSSCLTLCPTPHQLAVALRTGQAGAITIWRVTIVDATIIPAPSSPKNVRKLRYTEMHQTKNVNKWHFGMKLHIGVDEVLEL